MVLSKCIMLLLGWNLCSLLKQDSQWPPWEELQRSRLLHLDHYYTPGLEIGNKSQIMRKSFKEFFFLQIEMLKEEHFLVKRTLSYSTELMIIFLSVSTVCSSEKRWTLQSSPNHYLCCACDCRLRRDLQVFSPKKRWWKQEVKVFFGFHHLVLCTLFMWLF